MKCKKIISLAIAGTLALTSMGMDVSAAEGEMKAVYGIDVEEKTGDALTEIASGACGENLTWVLDTEGKLTISGEGMMSTGYYAAPWRQYRDQIQKVEIEEGVTSIGDYAFSDCSNLSSITIPESITSVGRDAFAGTKWMEEQRERNPLVVVNGILIDGGTCSGDVVIPEGVTSIGDYAFRLCSSLSSIVIPEGVTSIGDSAFSECSSLSSIVIPEGVTRIGAGAFAYCESLVEVVLPNAPISIGERAFYDTPWFIKQSEKNTLVIVNGNLIYVDKTAVGEKITIPNGVTSIADAAFSSCAALIEVSIPKTVSIIGEHAFAYCENLTSLVIPEQVTRIEYGTFYQCESLVEVTIPDSVTYIGVYAFTDCKLQQIKLPEELEYIGNYAFARTNITEIDIPENVRTIDFGAFQACRSLGKVVLHEGITNIGTIAFLGCEKLKEIAIPASITYIGSVALGFSATTNVNGEGAVKIENFIIYGTENSAAQQYAADNEFAFKLLKEPVTLSMGATQISVTDFTELIAANDMQDIIINNPDGVIFHFERGTMKLIEGKDSYDFGVEFITDYSQMDNPDFTAEEFALGICFNYSGELPGTAKITVPVSSKWIGQTLYYYEVLEDGTYKYTGRSGIVGKDGTITVSQSHCSKYVLTTKQSITFGDVSGDGSITAEDALAILKHVVGLEKLTGETLTSADVNADDAITAEDALDVLKKVVGLLDKFKAEED